MNVIDKIKLNFYPELKKINIDEKTLHQIFLNPNFNNQYKKVIKPFIQSFENYTHNTKENIDKDTINAHIKSAVELSIYNISNKYTTFVQNNGFQQLKIENPQVIKDKNFDSLFALINFDVFNNNVSQIINDGYGQQLLQVIESNSQIDYSKINSSFFDEKVWNIVSENSSIGDKKVLDLFKSKPEVLVDLINKNLFEGLKYTYENVPESHNFIENLPSSKEKRTVSFEQFSNEFINKIGIDTLKKLYEHLVFNNSKEFQKLFEITSYNNYELVQDIVNFDPNGFLFQNIDNKDMKEQILNVNSFNYDKREVFLNKYLGIEKKDMHYIKVFLHSIEKVKGEIPMEFIDKYYPTLQIIYDVLNADDEKIIEMSKRTDLIGKREINRNLLCECENDGNNILRNQFASELKARKEQLFRSVKPSYFDDGKGKNIAVYEVEGQPFTMLVHSVTNNPLSENNSHFKEIIDNPQKWFEITGGNNHISTSLISDKYMVTYGSPDDRNTIIFGFSDLPGDVIKYTDVTDAGINRSAIIESDVEYNMRNRNGIVDTNTVTTIDDLMDKSVRNAIQTAPSSRTWNEVGLSRVDKNKKKIAPNYIVCMDNINENSKKAASDLNLPIVLINRRFYKQLPYINNKDDRLEERPDETVNSFRK